jgi:uncharacterized membrane protein YhaH (DUF805 family)
MIESIKGSLRKSLDFRGKATRKEFWTFAAFYYLSFFVASFIDGLLGLPSVLTAIFYIGLLLPYINCAQRRIHDAGKSSWFILVPIYNLVLLLTPSKPSNQA